MATQFFSSAEIQELESWPAELGRDELVRYFRLAGEDVDWVNRTARGAPNKIGLAVQLCALPWLGFVPDDVRSAPSAAVARLATQVGVEAGALRYYGSRGQTRTDHLRLVAKRLGWRAAEADGRAGWKALREFLPPGPRRRKVRPRQRAAPAALRRDPGLCLQLRVTAMAEACGLTYDTLAWTNQWYLREKRCGKRTLRSWTTTTACRWRRPGAAERCPHRTASGSR